MLDFLRSRGFFEKKMSTTGSCSSPPLRQESPPEPQNAGGFHGCSSSILTVFDDIWILEFMEGFIYFDSLTLEVNHIAFGFILRLTPSNGWAMFTELERIWITRMNINILVDMEYDEVIRCHNVNRTFCTSKQTCHFLCSKLEKLSPSLPLQQATLNLANKVFPNLEANSSPKWSVENVNVS